jgi:hypothetical protein
MFRSSRAGRPTHPGSAEIWGWSITVIRFASEEQAHRNSDRPEQREWWRDASQHLARVVFHDAPKFHTYQNGCAA